LEVKGNIFLLIAINSDHFNMLISIPMLGTLLAEALDVLLLLEWAALPDLSEDAGSTRGNEVWSARMRGDWILGTTEGVK
jgi:hypothetical protein